METFPRVPNQEREWCMASPEQAMIEDVNASNNLPHPRRQRSQRNLHSSIRSRGSSRRSKPLCRECTSEDEDAPIRPRFSSFNRPKSSSISPRDELIKGLRDGPERGRPYIQLGSASIHRSQGAEIVYCEEDFDQTEGVGESSSSVGLRGRTETGQLRSRKRVKKQRSNSPDRLAPLLHHAAPMFNQSSENSRRKLRVTNPDSMSSDEPLNSGKCRKRESRNQEAGEDGISQADGRSDISGNMTSAANDGQRNEEPANMFDEQESSILCRVACSNARARRRRYSDFALECTVFSIRSRGAGHPALMEPIPVFSPTSTPTTPPPHPHIRLFSRPHGASTTNTIPSGRRDDTALRENMTILSSGATSTTPHRNSRIHFLKRPFGPRFTTNTLPPPLPRHQYRPKHWYVSLWKWFSTQPSNAHPGVSGHEFTTELHHDIAPAHWSLYWIQVLIWISFAVWMCITLGRVDDTLLFKCHELTTQLRLRFSNLIPSTPPSSSKPADISIPTEYHFSKQASQDTCILRPLARPAVLSAQFSTLLLTAVVCCGVAMMLQAVGHRIFGRWLRRSGSYGMRTLGCRVLIQVGASVLGSAAVLGIAWWIVGRGW